MKDFTYPAVFSSEPGQEIAVVFPDLDAATSGVCQDDAEQSARELLECVLTGLIEDGQSFPMATPAREIRLSENEKVVQISISLPPDRKQIPPEKVDQIVANCVANQRLEGLECSEEDLAAARRIVTGETTLAEELAVVITRYKEGNADER